MFNLVLIPDVKLDDYRGMFRGMFCIDFDSVEAAKIHFLSSTYFLPKQFTLFIMKRFIAYIKHIFAPSNGSGREEKA